MGKLKIQDIIDSKAGQFILDQVAENLPGEQKMDQVVDALVQEIDDHVFPFKEGSIGEVVTDAGLYIFIKPGIRKAAQEQFDKLRARGEV